MSGEPTALELACSTCRHHDAIHSAFGLCRLHPPTLAVVSDEGDLVGTRHRVVSVWPEVRPVDWCGQWCAVTECASGAS